MVLQTPQQGKSWLQKIIPMATLIASLQRWRADRGLAHVAPLVAFQVLHMLTMTATRHPALPWYTRAPEQWVYPLQTVICGLMVLWWWPRYECRRLRLPDIGWALGAGLLGIALWILPCEVFYRAGLADESVGIWKYFGVQSRETGFDPADAPWPWAALVFRFVRMVLVVAIIEEVFWRGFLMRWLVNPDGNIWRTPFGTHHVRALVGTVGAVVLVHQPADYAAAFIWGLLLYGIAVRTKSLAACILAHAVANLVLGIYVMQTGRYGFW